MAEHSPQFEIVVSRVRERLRSENIKLWLPPFTSSDGDLTGYPEEMITRFCEALSLPADYLREVLEHLRKHAVNKLQIVERFSKSGIATIKVHLTGNIPVGLNNRLEIQTGLHVIGADFRKSLNTETGLDSAKMKLICKGHVIEDDKSLESQQVKNNGQIMVLVLSEQSSEAQLRQNDEEQAAASLLKTRKAAEALSKRIDDFKDNKYFLEIRDQEGKPLNLPESERKALTLAMTFHEKGRSALNQRKYAEALLLLLEADKEFSHCSSQILKAVDNYGILCLDIVWAYFWLKSIVDLPNAEEKLQKCKECFERSYGQNFERLNVVRGGSEGELALFVRLHVLEAVCAYHRGDTIRTAALLDKAETEKAKLDIDKTKLTQLLLMGFTEAEARLGLRSCSGDATSAVDHITRKRQEKEERQKHEQDERERKKLERKLGKTASGEWVNVDTYNALVNMGYTERMAGEALRQADNDINGALQTLQDHPELLFIPFKRSKGDATHVKLSEEQIAQVVSLGFSVELSKKALYFCHGDVQQAIDTLVLSQGVLPTSSTAKLDHDEAFPAQIPKISVKTSLFVLAAGDNTRTDLRIGLFPSGVSKEDASNNSEGDSEEENGDPDVNGAMKELVSDLTNQDEQAHLNLSLEEESVIIAEYRTLLISTGFNSNISVGF